MRTLEAGKKGHNEVMGKDGLFVDLLKEIGKEWNEMQKQGERKREDTNTVVQERQKIGQTSRDREINSQQETPTGLS